MNARLHTRRTQQGLTLIELMIALMLGAFLLGGVIQTFSAARQSYRTQEGLSRLIENGRYAVEFITRDLRMAGFRGCNSELSLAGANNHLASPTDFLNDFDTALQGYESTTPPTGWQPAAINPAINAPNADTDIITIRRADETGYVVTDHATPANNITLASVAGLEIGDNVLIADCSQAEVFAITNVGVSTIAHGNTLTRNYPTGEVFPIDTISYYIKTANGIPSLYRKKGGDAQELIQGIEDLEIYYGVDTDMTIATGKSPDYTANYYVRAGSVPNMRQVVSVRVHLLVTTPDDNVTSEKASYSFDGIDVAADGAPDNRIRHEFTSTIALRNRIN